MFDRVSTLGATPVAAWTSALAEIPLADDPAELIDEIRALQELACAAQARQARLTARFDEVEQARQAAAGARASQRGRGIGEQVALARRESPTGAASTSPWPGSCPSCRTPPRRSGGAWSPSGG